MSVQIRIFMGYLQNKEIKMHLNQSANWKEAKLLHENSLMETQWQENDYIGLFIPSGMVSSQLKVKEQEVNQHMQAYFPKLNLEKHKILIFSQVFIS
jgi:hypothetical protein